MTGLKARLGELPLSAYIVLILVFLYAPILLLLVFSFNASTIVAFPLSGFTLDWYRSLSGDASLMQAIRNSAIIGLCAAALSTLIATISSYVMERYRIMGAATLTATTLSALVIPALVLGASLLVLISAAGIKLSLLTILLGHLTVATPPALVIMRTAFANVHREFEEASLDLGASALQTFARVSLPIAKPGLIASLLVAFTVSLDEFVISFFLAGSDITLPVYMWSQLRFPQKLPMLLAVASLQIALSAILIATAVLFVKKARARSFSSL
jgi:spermidine/putrescine transport system permease protein